MQEIYCFFAYKMYIQEGNNNNEVLNIQNTKRFRLCEMMNDWGERERDREREELFIAKLMIY